MTLSHLFKQTPVLKIGHRGAPDNYLENTIPSFKDAQQRGAHAVELDIQLSNDLIPVVHHDHSLKRSFGIDRKVNELSLESLRDCCPGLPTLHEVLQQLEGFPINIELKKETFSPKVISSFVESIRSSNTERCWFSSFNASLIHRLLKLAPELQVGYLLPVPWISVKSALKRIHQFQPIAIHCHHKQLTPTLEVLKETSSLPIFSYTATTKEEHLWMKSQSVNGIFTNNLSQAHEVFA